MCGFTGFLTRESPQATDGLLRRMADTIIHRGPDADGYWHDDHKHIGLAHRRLSIVDLSDAGQQPMASASGRYLIAFNGEIYNHGALRESLAQSFPGDVWRGHSDTETLLAGIDSWGVRDTVDRLIGMFAFAVWDRQTDTLTLVRDRLGEKPLYYGWQGGTFLFGSELKALRMHPSFQNQIDRGALSLFLRSSYVPAPYSIYQGIYKLEPGCLLSVSLRQPEPELLRYWSGVEVATTGAANTTPVDVVRAIDDLEVLLKDAIRQQMTADVPLGAFLSGGVDSSAVVALMQAQSSRSVKTFTVGFNEKGFNEAEHAKLVAHHLGTDHTELYITAQDAMAVIPRLPTLYDEPFGDSSQIPTFLVSQLARQHVTVSLSGDAGDELFCGYNRYLATHDLWRKLSRLPLSVRRFSARTLTSVPPAIWSLVAGLLGDSGQLGDKIHKGAGVLASGSAQALYLGLVSSWQDPASVVINGVEPPTLLSGIAPNLPGLNDVQRMMALDLMTYLPDDVLAKVDRAAMGVSLETRVPFLDHRVVEMAWRLPMSLKLRDGQSKWILRQVLYKHVPKALIDRPKMGFGVPIDSWLRGPLRQWAEDLLDETRIAREGYFRPAQIRQKWREHLTGQHNWQHQLWNVLMFQSWLESQNNAN